MQLPLRVSVSMPLDKIANAIGAKIEGAVFTPVSGVCLDTRAIQKGDLFFALKASRDGHDFVNQALEKGAAAAVIHRDVPNSPGGSLLRVNDTQKALGLLGRHARRHWGKTVVAVCGSNGKTSTKEITSAIVGAHKKVHKTPGNWNNALGLPLALLLLNPEHEVAVLEMGINDFGEMTELAQISEPNIGVLTNIGPEHLEKFGTIDGVAKAEGELFDSLPANGTAVINLDDFKIQPMAQRLSLRKVTFSLKEHADITAKVIRDHGAEGLTLKVKYGDEEVELRFRLMGVHNVYNLLSALSVGWALQIPKERLQTGIDAIEIPDMRLEILKAPDGIRIVNDCYNANPASMLAALEVIENLAPSRKIAVLGDMLELGEISARAHRDIGIKVANSHFSYFFTMGRFAGDFAQGAIQGGMARERVKSFKTHAQAAKALKEVIQPNDTILVKGSRGMTMEKVSEQVLKLLEGKA